MLRSSDFWVLVIQSVIGVSAWLSARRLVPGRERRPFIRVLFARPLWWLAAWLLAVPDASARYARFRVRALARWETLLLAEDNRSKG